MQFKFLISSNILGFPSEEYGRLRIEKCLKSFTDELNINHLSDWKVTFFGVFTETKSIRVLKRGITLTKLKSKEIFIHIPIPSNKEVEWGINPDKFCKTLVVSEDKFIIIPIDFQQFDNMEDLIVNAACTGIHTALNVGITIEGKKIRLKEN